MVLSFAKRWRQTKVIIPLKAEKDDRCSPKEQVFFAHRILPMGEKNVLLGGLCVSAVNQH